MTIEAVDGRCETLAFRDRGDVEARLGALAEDFVFNEVGLTLTLDRLKPGTYAVRTWHHDARYAGGMIDVAVGSRIAAGGLPQTTGLSADPAWAAFTVRANGNDPVVVQITSQSRDDKFVAYLNGFAIVPIRTVAAFDQDLSARPITQATEVSHRAGSAGAMGDGPLEWTEQPVEKGELGQHEREWKRRSHSLSAALEPHSSRRLIVRRQVMVGSSPSVIVWQRRGYAASAAMRWSNSPFQRAARGTSLFWALRENR